MITKDMLRDMAMDFETRLKNHSDEAKCSDEVCGILGLVTMSLNEAISSMPED